MQAPLGIFDSGVGGLTVVRAIRDRIPGVPIRYLGDTARLPYGTKSPRTVIRYAINCLNLLLRMGPLSGLVVACNTASAHASTTIQAHVDGRFPVWGVLEPGARVAATRSPKGRIGVLATPGTIESKGYEVAIHGLRPDANIFPLSAALLVPLAEEGYRDGPVVDAVLSDYLTPLLELEIDTLVLGCTHYPLLAPAIERWFAHRTHEVLIVDSARATAEVVGASLEFSPGDTGQSLQIMVTDAGARFRDIACRFLDEKVEIQEVDL